MKVPGCVFFALQKEIKNLLEGFILQQYAVHSSEVLQVNVAALNYMQRTTHNKYAMPMQCSPVPCRNFRDP